MVAKHEIKCLARSFGRGVKIIPKNIFEENFNLPENVFSTISGIIIGGSGEFSFSKKEKNPELWAEIKKTVPFIKAAIKNNIPILGICFGHQLLAHIMGSKVINDKTQKEIGVFNVFLTKAGEADFLFSRMPSNFLAQEGHEDSVKKLPKGAILLAKGEKCKIQAFRFKKYCYGVQFHPELRTVKDAKLRLRANPKYIEDGTRVKIMATPVTKNILENFTAEKMV